MKLKKALCLLLACAVLAGCMSAPAGAAEAVHHVNQEIMPASVLATNEFNMNVPANTILPASTSFSLEAGETVTIKASYSPFSASVDFGLIDSGSIFHYLNTTDGSFDETIKIEERGNYTFAVRNNSDQTVKVAGFVKY